MGDESKKPGILARIGKVFAAADATREKMASALGLKSWASVTEKAFGPDAARLETQSSEAMKQGHFFEAASLGIKSMGHGLTDMAQKGAMKRVTGGENVETHGNAPATPVGTDKRSLKR